MGEGERTRNNFLFYVNPYDGESDGHGIFACSQCSAQKQGMDNLKYFKHLLYNIENVIQHRIYLSPA